MRAVSARSRGNGSLWISYDRASWGAGVLRPYMRRALLGDEWMQRDRVDAGRSEPRPYKGTEDGHERRARKTGTEDGHGRRARKTSTKDGHGRQARKTGTEDGHGRRARRCRAPTRGWAVVAIAVRAFCWGGRGWR